jgi:hypothetical protein
MTGIRACCCESCEYNASNGAKPVNELRDSSTETGEGDHGYDFVGRRRTIHYVISYEVRCYRFITGMNIGWKEEGRLQKHRRVDLRPDTGSNTYLLLNQRFPNVVPLLFIALRAQFLADRPADAPTGEVNRLSGCLQVLQL